MSPYFIAAASLGAAIGLRLLLDRALGEVQPLTTLYLAIAITAWFGGLWPALAVTLVGYLVAEWLFIAPRYAFGILHPHVLVGAPLYFLVGAVIAGVTESVRREERRADQKVREAADRAAELQALFDAAPIGIWVAHDPTCERITGNRFADQLLGVPAGGNVSLSAPPDQQVVPLRAMNEGRRLAPDELPLQIAVRTGRPVEHAEFDLLFDDGRTVSLAGGAAPVMDANGRVRGAIVAMSDVSAQKRATKLSARVHRITDAMGEDLPLDKLLHEVLVRVLEVLPADAAVLLVGNVEKDEEVVLHVRATVGLPGVELGSVALRRGFGVAVARERRVKVWTDVDPEQPYRPLLLGALVRSLAGVPLLLGDHVVGVLEVGSLRLRQFTEDDVNLLQIAGERIALGIERAARRDAERQIRESLEASNRVKDEFLAMLGHELRNPLSAVRNAVAIASLDEVRRPRALEIARRQVDQLGRLIDDLLDVTRITQGRIVLRKERMNLTEIIERAVESVRPLVEERGVHLTVAHTTPAVRVDADPARLEQVFVNLLSNATKYNDAGGRIDVTSVRQGDQVAIHVRDTGIGIAPEMLPRMWELFAQGERTLARAQGGLGIGLTLARQLVELHGGRIEAHSDGLGKGAEFVVRLAALPVAAGASIPSVAPLPEPEQRARVLVVEDNPDTAESLKMLLELLGHRVRTVYDGVAALDAAHGSPPDVMLVDIGLPGMDGYELARRVRQDPDLDRVVLIALTGYGREEDKQQAMAAGFDYHLVKPVSPDALHGLVARLARPEAAKLTVH